MRKAQSYNSNTALWSARKKLISDITQRTDEGNGDSKYEKIKQNQAIFASFKSKDPPSTSSAPVQNNPVVIPPLPPVVVVSPYEFPQTKFSNGNNSIQVRSNQPINGFTKLLAAPIIPAINTLVVPYVVSFSFYIMPGDDSWGGFTISTVNTDENYTTAVLTNLFTSFQTGIILYTKYSNAGVSWNYYDSGVKTSGGGTNVGDKGTYGSVVWTITEYTPGNIKIYSTDNYGNGTPQLQISKSAAWSNNPTKYIGAIGTNKDYDTSLYLHATPASIPRS
jgi:hypothetical protein